MIDKKCLICNNGKIVEQKWVEELHSNMIKFISKFGIYGDLETKKGI